MKTLLFLLASLFFISNAKATNYYFSNNSGNDDRTAKEAQSPSTPWKTLNKLNSFSGDLQPGDHILFKRGETFYGSITLKKSGTPDMPIVFSTYGTGEKPVITSLVNLTNWTPTAGYKGVYESSDASLGKSVSILLVNNVLQQLGRYPNADAPNKGYLTIKSHNSNISITDNELPPTPNWTGAQLVIRMARWKLDKEQIISHEGNTITYKAFSKSTPTDNYGYFIQNDVKTLDQFGEWYYDPSSKKMYVYFGQKPPSSYSVKASTIAALIYSNNNSNLVFDNLSIQGADAYGFRINNCTNVSIQNCDILFSGNTGISFGTSSSNLNIQNCTVAYSNSWGMKLGNTTGSIVKNNVIRNSGAIAGMGESDSAPYKGLEFGGSDDVIENNEIDSSGYIGINFNGNNQTIKNNVINTFGFVKDDGGGIYTWAGNANTIFSNRKVIGNIVLNGTGAQAGTNSPNSAANGIYMDGANGVEITGNTVANTFRGIFVNNAFNIIVKDNTSFNNQTACYMQHAGHLGNNTIVNNTFFSKLPTQQPFEIFTNGNDVDNVLGTIDNNYYGRPLGNDRVFKQTYKNVEGKKVSEALSLNDWKTLRGKDPSSHILSMQGRRNINPDDYVRFEYNGTAADKTVSLAGNYKDVNNNSYSKSIVIKPYSSIILLKQ
ncbi:right-handed parallel beta-helix repeat-containing protein [Segetibacter koreensis]|uniref:right-handed parallel beta-helix repeat-containing protein n=1 Tax=Segetibacter koreensis TaxID=398037 RepID=UPI000375FAE5|nr:right-handed parallel beta-helix repeat-containing protein [Segetibacter koreensis]